MSLHLRRDILIAYSPSADAKWKPENMELGRFYPVFAYENGTLKRSDGAIGEATYYHFVGDGNRPSRLIQSSAVLMLDNNTIPALSEADYDFIFAGISREHNKGSATVGKDEPGF